MAGAWEDFLHIVTNVANVLAIFAFVAWLVGAAGFWLKRREYKRRLGLLSAPNSERPAALAVGLGQGIKGAVEKYLAGQGKAIHVYDVTRNGIVPHDEFANVLEEVRKIKGELTDAGITELHFFYMGPVSVSAAIGAIFDNWVPTTVYNYVNGTYHPDLVICREMSIGTDLH